MDQFPLQMSIDASERIVEFCSPRRKPQISPAVGNFGGNVCC